MVKVCGVICSVVGGLAVGKVKTFIRGTVINVISDMRQAVFKTHLNFFFTRVFKCAFLFVFVVLTPVLFVYPQSTRKDP